MNDERDLIVKRIIPLLRKMCLERDIVLTCVDLRWYGIYLDLLVVSINFRRGVTESQSQQAATLLMVLREIEKSDIFLGCIGERYGSFITGATTITYKTLQSSAPSKLPTYLRKGIPQGYDVTL